MAAWYRRRAAGYPSRVRSVSNLIRLVQIRLRVQRWVDVASPALLVGFAIALPGLVLSRVFGARGDVVALAMLVAAATAVAWFLAQLHPPINALRAAVEADERLGLEGRLASALALENRSDAFAQAAVQDAERAARDPALRAMVRRVFALRWPRSTPWIPVVAAVLVMCAWLQPVRVAAPVVSAGIEASVTPAEQQARADAAEASVAKALDTISDNPEAREQLKDMLAQMEQPPAGELSERDATAREADAAGRAALLEKHPDAIMLSAHAPGDVSALRETIIGFFEAAMVEDVLVLPYAKQGLIGEVYESARVLSETYDETGRVLQVRGLPGAIARLQRSLTAN